MFTRILFAVALAAAATGPAFPQAAIPSTAVTPTPDERARAWLVLVDDKDYAKSWAQTGGAFKAHRKADAWTKGMAEKRAPMGAVASRDLKSIDLSRNNIAVIRYDTVFAHKAAAIETVTLAFENNGWSVADYSID